MAHPAGVEPTTFWSVVRRSIQLSYGCTLSVYIILKKNGGEGGIWTLDPSFSPDTPLAGERIRPLCHFSTYIKNKWRVNRDSNPESFRLAGFQDRSLSRSDIHPHLLNYYIILLYILSILFLFLWYFFYMYTFLAFIFNVLTISIF